MDQATNRNSDVAIAIAGVFCTIWICLYTFLHQYTFADDAFIFFRYVQNMAIGHGPVFNPGDRVEGYTSPLWLGILYLFNIAGMDTLHAATVMGMLCCIGTIILVLHFPILQQRTTYRILMTLVVCTQSWFLFWITSGMETMLFTFLILLSATMFILEKDHHRSHLKSGVITALTFLARPEGILLLPIFMFSTSKKFSLLSGWLPLVLAYQLFRLMYFDSLFPNTAAAKINPGWSAFDMGTAYVLNFFTDVPFACLILVPVIFRMINRRPDTQQQTFTDTHGVYLGIIAMLIYFIVIGGDFFEHHRFFVPLLPWFSLLIAYGADKIHNAIRLTACKNWFQFAVIITPIACLSFPGIHSSLWQEKHGVDWIVASGKLGKTVAEHFPKDTSLAAPHIGALGYYSQRNLLDMLGLTNRHIANSDPNHPIYHQYKKKDVGHERFDIDYAIRQAPDFFIPLRGLSSVPATHISEVPVRFAMEFALVEKLKLNPDYEVYNIPVDENLLWITLIRKKFSGAVQ